MAQLGLKSMVRMGSRRDGGRLGRYLQKPGKKVTFRIKLVKLNIKYMQTNKTEWIYLANCEVSQEIIHLYVKEKSVGASKLQSH